MPSPEVSKTVPANSKVMAGIVPSRINNRGPPRFTEIPFEAIPLEVLSSQTPGQKPIVQIQQRPFQTRVKLQKPTATKKVNQNHSYHFVTFILNIINFTIKRILMFDWSLFQRKPPVFATGIPLPQLLIPEGDLKRPTNKPITKLPASVINSQLSNDFVIKDVADKGDNRLSLSPTKISIVNNNKNGPIPGSGNPVLFPKVPSNEYNGDIQGERDKEQNYNDNRLSLLNDKVKDLLNVPAASTESSKQNRPAILNTTPRVQNSSYRPPTTFKIVKQTPQPGNNVPLNPNVSPQNNQKQQINWSTTNSPNVSYGTRRTPPLVSPGYHLRPTKRPIVNSNGSNNRFDDIVTGRPGTRPGFAPRPVNDRNVFDVTVSADQNYGANDNQLPSGKILN